MRQRFMVVPAFVITLLVVVGCTSATVPTVSQPELEQKTEPSSDAAASESAPEAGTQSSSPPSPTPSLEEIALSMFPASVTAQGDLLIVYGQVTDTNGSPLEGVSVEFWQTDYAGIYDHPGDSDTANRDQGFQFYGTSIALSSGEYAFRSVFPGQYEPRPRHIHVKVKQNGVEILTTQFYFAVDGASGGVGGPTNNLLLSTKPATAADGFSVQVARFDLVVNTGAGNGSLRLTDSQGEGPYYPVVDVSGFDNDLASVDP